MPACPGAPGSVTDEDGAMAIEYSLVAALITVTAAVVIAAGFCA
jgi:Flp pilus assembly pilin Flp